MRNIIFINIYGSKNRNGTLKIIEKISRFDWAFNYNGRGRIISATNRSSVIYINLINNR